MPKKVKEIIFNKNSNKWFSGKILELIDLYRLITTNEKICVGLSGGVDSMSLLFILEYIRRFSYLKYDLSAIHVQVYKKSDVNILQSYCDELGVKFVDIGIRKTNLPVPEKGICYTCSKLRKGAMIEYLKSEGINKLALGHHADDLAETLLMNMDYHRNVDALKPMTYLDRNEFTIIRPLLCLTKEEIVRVSKYYDIPISEYSCGYEENNMREKYRGMIRDIEKKSPGFSSRVAEAYLRNSKFCPR